MCVLKCKHWHKLRRKIGSWFYPNYGFYIFIWTLLSKFRLPDPYEFHRWWMSLRIFDNEVPRGNQILKLFLNLNLILKSLGQRCTYWFWLAWCFYRNFELNFISRLESVLAEMLLSFLLSIWLYYLMHAVKRQVIILIFISK